MLPGIQALFELSRIDVEIASLEEQRAALPAARDAFEKDRERAAAAVATAEEALQAAEQEQRRHEAAVTDQEALVAKLEGQQHQVKTNEAYTALLSEVEAAKSAISDAETLILEAMEGIEAAKADLERAQTTAKGAEERIARDEAALAEREKSLDQSLANLARERETALANVEPPLLERYTKIAARRRPAVVAIKKEACSGCRVALPPQLLLEMRKGEELIACGNCHRILILDGER